MPAGPRRRIVAQVQTRVDELSDGIFRLSSAVDGGQPGLHAYLIDADEPLVYHSALDDGLGGEAIAAIERVMPRERVRWICPGRGNGADGLDGAMQRLLAALPDASLVCRPDSPLATSPQAHAAGPDGHLELGGRTIVLFDAAPLAAPGAAVVAETVTGTLLTGGLGANDRAADEWLDAAALDHHGMPVPDPMGAASLLARLAGLRPAMLLAEYGAPWRGDIATALAGLAGYYATVPAQHAPPGGCAASGITSVFDKPRREQLR